MSRIDGKICLVSGAGRGIGAAIAKVLAEAGGAVAVTDLDGATAERTAAALKTGGAKAIALQHDVTDEAAWERVVGETVAAFGGLDVLVNNAGVFKAVPIEEMTIADWRWLSGPNLEGVLLGTKHGIKAMKDPARRKQFAGSIINLSSIAGLVGSVRASAYCMTKGGVRIFTKAVALECADLGYNIRVNSIHPGVIDTDMGAVAIQNRGKGLNDPAAAREMVARQHPLGRLGTAEDIANGALFLASEASSFMTGAELVVDGGITAR